MKEEIYLQFEDYCQNLLSIEDKIIFENQLKTDNNLNEKFEIYKNVNSFLDHKFSIETTSFKENVKKIADENNRKATKSFALKPYQYAIAASLALIIGLVFFNQNNNPNFEDYNHYEEAQFTERGDVIKSLKLAQEAFNAKNYGKAIPLFEIVLKEYPRPEIEYFYGISLLEDSRIDDAEMIFNKLKDGKSIYKTKAIWGLALSKLKQKDYVACKNILITIPNDYEDYETVLKLLKTL